MYIVCFIDCHLRSRVNSVYRKKFVTVNDAEIHYGLTLSDSLAELVIDKRSKSRRPKRSVISGMSTEAPPSPPASTASTASTSTTASSSGQPSVTVENLFRLASLLDNKDLEMLTNKLFLQLALANNITPILQIFVRCLLKLWNC